MNVAEAVAATLRDAGIGTVFAVLGDANLRVLAALADPAGDTRVIYARHETTAVAMADGYARGSGTVGVASVTAGPGLALTALPLLTAARRRMPLLLVAGDAAVGDTDSIQQLDQRRFVQGLGLEQLALVCPATAADDVRYALELASSRQQPVVLSLPTDVQAHAYPGQPPGRVAAGFRWRTPIVPAPAELDRAASLARSARSPVVIAGRGALEDRAGAEVERLARALSAPVFTTLPARGLVAEDGILGYGVAGGYASDHGTRALAAADCVIAVGARLTSYTTVEGTLFPSARLIRIDHRPPEPSRTVPPATCYLQGGARATVAALAARLVPGGAETTWAGPAPAPERPADPPTVGGRLHPGYVLRELDRTVPADATVVIGVGHFASFAVESLRPARRRFVFTHDFGAIGQGLPMAIGAAAAGGGSRPVLVEGDASILMCIQELDTAARYRLPVTAVVLNDEAVGAEYHKLRAAGLDGRPALLPSPDLAAVARAFGAEAATVRTPEELARALRASRRATGSYLIDARISRDVVSTLYRRRHSPAP